MTAHIPTSKLTRAGIYVLLAMLLVLLGAAAKHSQFDGPPHHGFLAKAVKMVDGARCQPSDPAEVTPTVAVQSAGLLSAEHAMVRITPAEFRFTPVSLCFPPLRA